MNAISSFFLAAALSTGTALLGQSPSRSGFPAPADAVALRQFPCAGEALFAAFFDDPGLPPGWQTLDLDGGEPRPEIRSLIGPGWQVIPDFKRPWSNALASASWYSDSSLRSDDWVITPRVALSSNVCFSWFAYSQDQFYPESYEVRISTTTADTAGFLAEPPLAVIAAEGSLVNYRSVNLRAYAGQDVYLAFRHTSKNRFILVLDDIRLAQVTERDLAIHSVVIPTGNEGFPYRIRGAVGNFGSDTLRFANNLRVSYSINGGPARTYTRRDTFSLIPNDTIRFSHDSIWRPADPVAYLLKVWVDSIAGDVNRANDTALHWVGIGFATAIDPERLQAPWRIFPNPATDALILQADDPAFLPAEAAIISLTGSRRRAVLAPWGTDWRLDLGDLPAGLYLLEVKALDGRARAAQFVKQ